jgi:hypothetical protein
MVTLHGGMGFAVCGSDIIYLNTHSIKYINIKKFLRVKACDFVLSPR